MTPANPDALADARDLIRQSLKVGAPGLSEAAREAVVRSIMLKLEGKLLAPLLADLQRVTAERDAAREEAYGLKLAAAGGEDAPDSASLVTADDVRCWRDEETRALAAAEARAAQLQAEVEAKDRALKDERARRKAATQSLREKAAALCDEAAAYFDRTTGHYDRTQAAGGYRATASKIRLLTPDRTALAARAATAREG